MRGQPDLARDFIGPLHSHYHCTCALRKADGTVLWNRHHQPKPSMSISHFEALGYSRAHGPCRHGKLSTVWKLWNRSCRSSNSMHERFFVACVMSHLTTASRMAGPQHTTLPSQWPLPAPAVPHASARSSSIMPWQLVGLGDPGSNRGTPISCVASGERLLPDTLSPDAVEDESCLILSVWCRKKETSKGASGARAVGKLKDINPRDHPLN
jgi:hypothetical protein